ncbi:tetratricopeptide repeat-containing protein [Sphaerisporangium fuscum]|uniref:tetratricopeptide repeat-containing protein n=1 Tax=Sphaerisporangium fuscum TaxID=2835868 RepID=UPI001BDD7626|nr:tetratricopeptide repeat-containing protein [Sphaerisporangium fuscum]
MTNLEHVADHLLMSRPDTAFGDLRDELAECVARLREAVSAELGDAPEWRVFIKHADSFFDFPPERVRRALTKKIERRARRDDHFAGDLAALLAELARLGAVDSLIGHLANRERFGLRHAFSMAIDLGLRAEARNALAACDRLTAAVVRILGADHPCALAARQSLAGLYRDIGRLRRATTMLDRIAADRARVLGPDHPDTLTTRAHQALWRGHGGDAPAAVAMIAQLLPEYTRVLGADHPDTLTVRGHLAEWKGKAGDWAAAKALTESLLADRTRTLGAEHPDTLKARENLDYWCERLCEGDSASRSGQAG